ncbi:MAG: hypothetical protein JNK72_01975 [Myxococcales bacterium]|nr:hypothetical protein [Myxococcales bacterium]
MATVRTAPLIVAALFALTACNRVRRWRHRRHTVTAASVDPRAQRATACWDPRFVSGQRVDAIGMPHGALPALAAGPRGAALAYRSDDGLKLVVDGEATRHLDDDASVDALSLVPGPAEWYLVAHHPGDDHWSLRDTRGRVWRGPPGLLSLRAVATPEGLYAVGHTPQRVLVFALDAALAPRGRPRSVDEAAVDVDIVNMAGRPWALWSRNVGGAGQLRAARVGDAGLDVMTLLARTTSVGLLQGAVGGARLAVAFSDHDTGGLSLNVATFSRSGRVGATVERLSARFAPDARASLAWDGGAFGVAWSEPVSGGDPRGFAALVDPQAMRLGHAMRVQTETPVGLTGGALVWRPNGYRIAFARSDHRVDLRDVGPRLCDPPIDPRLVPDPATPRDARFGAHSAPEALTAGQM